MFKTIKKRFKNEKGLSLVELLAVIVILAIVAAIAIPAIGNIIKNSEAKAEVADAIQILNGANIYFTDNPGEPKFVLANAGDYVELNGDITAFTVTKATTATDKNKITFTGKQVGTITDKTLEDLSNAKYSKGVVSFSPATGPVEGEGE